VPTGPAAHVEQQVAWLHAESVEPDGEHALLLPLQVQADAVLLDGLLGGVRPRPLVDDALAPPGADRLAQVGLVERPAQLGGQRLAVAGLDQTTSGMAPPVVATTGVPQDIASMAGSEKPS
jgi:hypothetical protein